MSYDKVAKVNIEKIIGTKQVIKAIKNGEAKEVIMLVTQINILLAKCHMSRKITMFP